MGAMKNRKNQTPRQLHFEIEEKKPCRR